MADFTVNNTAPDLTGRDNNFSVDLFFAPKAAGLDQTSTSGWHRPGAVEPGSYSAEFQTSVNSTQLGTTKVKKSFHINEQGAVIGASLTEISPFGNDLLNKTDLVATPTYGTFLDATVDAGGGGVKTITLAATGTLDAGIVGKKVEVTNSSGTPEYPAYSRVESVNGQAITLEFALDEAPQDGALVRHVESVRWLRGGVTLARRSFLGVVSGDFDDTIVHFAKDTVMTEGSPQYPDANVGMAQIQFEVVPETRLINGKKQPILLEEDLRWD